MYRLALALGLLAGCATPPALVAAPAPASPEARYAVTLAPLTPALQPVLPSSLRPTSPPAMMAGMDHAAMGHGMPASGETDSMPVDAAAPEALADALDAYLAMQSALARDQFEGVSDHALAFADAWSFAVEEAPEADPHFWHLRASEVRAVETHALALSDAVDLHAAREAFGHLSAGFVALLEAHGSPPGYDLSRFTCGMRSDLPEGGVWLQRGSETQSPYFGTRMLACGTRDATIPSRTGDMVMDVPPEPYPANASGATDHGSADHETMAHD